MTNILIYVPVWGREKITEICFLGISRLQHYNPKKYQISAVIVGSDTWLENMCALYGYHFVEANNEPLGAKLNTGLTYLMGLEFDYMMTLGSDNLLAGELLDYYDPFFEDRSPFFGIKTSFFVDPIKRVAKQVNYDQVFGAGRCFSREMLDKTVMCKHVRFNVSMAGYTVYRSGDEGWLPIEQVDRIAAAGGVAILNDQPVAFLWQADKSRALDIKAEIRLMGMGYQSMEILHPDRELVEIDLKTGENIWPYDQFPGIEVDIDYALSIVSELEKGYISQLCKE